jgi:hypothetical protein
MTEDALEVVAGAAQDSGEPFSTPGRAPHDCPPPGARLPDSLDETENGPSGAIESADKPSRKARLWRLLGGRKPGV